MLDLVISIIGHWMCVLLLAPLFPGITAQVKAKFAGKAGPSVFQPYFDLARLARKKCVYSLTATWFFHGAPVVVLAAMLMASLLVPFGVSKAPVAFTGDIILLAYILALARFVMIVASMEAGFSMQGMGASREAFFSCLGELALFMNLITLAVMAHSVSLSRMIGADVPVSWHAMGPAFLLVVASLFIVLLAENCRIPVDDPDTHLELTMIHEVMLLEYSGVDLAYMLYGAAVKLLVFAGILVPLLIPVQTGHAGLDVLVFLGGMLGLAVLVGIVESCMARLRLNRVRNFLLTAFALAFFGFIVTLWRA